MGKFIKNISISKKIAIIVWVFSLAIILLLLVSYLSFTYISLLRSIVLGENLLVKSQKDALVYITKYSVTHNDQDYKSFVVKLYPIQFYKTALLELEKPTTDFGAVDQALVDGGMDQKNVRQVGYFLKYGKGIPFVASLLADWKAIEEHAEKVSLMGEQIRDGVQAAGSPGDFVAVTNTLSDTNATLTELEIHVDQTLDQAAYIATVISQVIMVVLTVLFLILGIVIAHAVSKYLRGEIQNLRAGADKMAMGDFTSFGSIYGSTSGDEIGQLTSSIKSMASDLKDFYETLDKKVKDRTMELQKANADIEVQNKALQEALDMKGEFLKVANHQLNTPLSIMNNAYAMVQDKTISSKKGFEFLGEGLRRINQVTKDFWDTLEAQGEYISNIAKNDITPIVKEVVDSTKKAIALEDKKVDIIIQEPDFKMPQVMCDISRIRNVVYNLVENAVWYTRAGSVTISYELIADGEYLKMNIQDTGIGFDKEDKEKMGQKFFRSKDALLAHPNGSGLGLFICRMIVESHGGKFRFESEGKGLGSTFSFSLPVAKY